MAAGNSNATAVKREDIEYNVNIKMEEAVGGPSDTPVTMEDVQRTPEPESLRPVKQEQLDVPRKREEDNAPSPLASSTAKEATGPRDKLDIQTHRARVIIQRYVRQKLSVGIPLAPAEINQLVSVIRFCSRLSADAKPYIERYTLNKALRHVLRASSILPDYLPPQIEVLLSAWARDEYNLDIDDVGDVDEEPSEESESEDESDIDQGLTIGRGSAMRGIEIKKSANGHTVYILKKGAKRASSVIGHNGLKVGAWWPMQICALRDGAHGSRMGGIAGKAMTGAYSIVISGGGGGDYDDRDMGNVVWYTGSGDSKEGDQPLTNANQSLITSFNRKLPVRVIRTSRLKSDYAPTKGMRYDGLYEVAWYGQVEGPYGYRIWRFKMVRLPDQDPIRREVPTRVELRTLG
jgi:hypothetical protein